MACSKLPDSTSYHLPSAIPFSTRMNADKLERAVRSVIARRPALRTRIVDECGCFRQFSDPDMQIEVRRARMPESEALVYIDHDFVRPFSLFDASPLCRFEILETECHVWLLIDFHHVIADGMTIAQSFIGYDLPMAFEGLPLEEESGGLYLWAEKEEARLGSAEYDRAKASCLQAFEGVGFSNLPLANVGLVGKSIFVSETVSRQDVDLWCENHHTQNNLLFLAAFSVLLSKWCGSDRVAFATLSHGRHQRNLRRTYGMFVETLPFTCEVNPAMTIVSFVRSLRSSLMAATRHSAYPYTHFCNDMRQTAPVCFAFQGKDIMERVSVGQECVEGIQLHKGESANGLNCIIYNRSGAYEIRMDASEACVGEKTLRLFARAMVTCLNEMMRHPDGLVGDVESVDVKERMQIMRRSVGENSSGTTDMVGETFVDLFLAQARLTPQSIAVSDGSTRLTYADLEERSRLLAGWLRCQGVLRGCFVGILTVPCCGFLTAALAVMRAAAAYVPMETSLPLSERQRLITEAEIDVLLNPSDLPLIPHGQCSDDSLPLLVQDDAAYMIYTSGTTGVPKGVVIPHRAVTNLVRFLVRRWHLSGKSRISCHSSLAFDASVEDLFPVLTVGGQVLMMPEEVRHDVGEIHRFIDEHEVTGGCYTTRLGVMIASQPHPSLDYICLGGEQLTVAPKSSCHVYNTYGPTEFCVDATYYELVQGRSYETIPIGRPLDHLGAYVMDLHGRLLSWGAVGELCLSGPQMALGYWKDPELTSRQFRMSGIPGLKVYHTGDLVYWNEEGQLEYVGRKDRQAKVNGYRVSLDDVERRVSSLALVSQVYVALVSPHGHAQLCAYYTSDADVGSKTLSEQLRKTCPAYLVPSYWVRMQHLPLLPNGKVDRSALPSPDVHACPTHTVPVKPLERLLCQAFEEVLQIERVGVDDDFFDLGGSSLTVMQLMSEMEKRGVSLAYGTVFKFPTPRKLAEFMEDLVPQPSFTIDAYDYGHIHHALRGRMREVADRMASPLPATVLLTGATGFLGAHVLRECLALGCERIYCLVRAGSEQEAISRLEESQSFYFPGLFNDGDRNRVMVVRGDLTDATWLDGCCGKGIEVVINCAADVRHYALQRQLERVNTEAIHPLIRFCASSHARLVQVSTLSIAGFHSPSEGETERLTEQNLYIGQQLLDPYSYSKFLAERALLERVSDGFLDALIVRIGNLTGRSYDGRFQRNEEGNGLLMSLRLCGLVGMLPSSLAHLKVDVSPVDVVAKGLVGLALSDGMPFVCHLSNPHLHTLYDLLRGMGLHVEIVEDDIFSRQLEKTKADKNLSKMALSAISYLSMSSSGCVPNAFDSTLTAPLLRGLGVTW